MKEERGSKNLTISDAQKADDPAAMARRGELAKLLIDNIKKTDKKEGVLAVKMLGKLLDMANEDESGQVRRMVQDSKILSSKKITPQAVDTFVETDKTKTISEWDQTFRLYRIAEAQKKQKMPEVEAQLKSPHIEEAAKYFIRNQQFLDDFLKQTRVQKALGEKPEVINMLMAVAIAQKDKTFPEVMADRLLKSAQIPQVTRDNLNKRYDSMMLYNTMTEHFAKLSSDQPRLFRQMSELMPEHRDLFLAENKSSLITKANSSAGFYEQLSTFLLQDGLQKAHENFKEDLNIAEGIMHYKALAALPNLKIDRLYDFLKENGKDGGNIFSRLPVQDKENFIMKLGDRPDLIVKMMKDDNLQNIVKPSLLDPSKCAGIILKGDVELRDHLLTLLNGSELRANPKYIGFADQLYEKRLAELTSPDDRQAFLEKHQDNFSANMWENLKEKNFYGSPALRNYHEENFMVKQQIEQLVGQRHDPHFAQNIVKLIEARPEMMSKIVGRLPPKSAEGKAFREGLANNPDVMLGLLNNPELRKNVINMRFVDPEVGEDNKFKSPNTRTMMANSSPEFRLALLKTLEEGFRIVKGDKNFVLFDELSRRKHADEASVRLSEKQSPSALRMENAEAALPAKTAKWEAVAKAAESAPAASASTSPSPSVGSPYVSGKATPTAESPAASPSQSPAVQQHKPVSPHSPSNSGLKR